MYKSVSYTFLASAVAIGLLFTSFLPLQASAATVTSQDIIQQEAVAKEEAKEAIGEYVRLILFQIIQRLEARIAQK